jgi:hypothetical protein
MLQGQHHFTGEDAVSTSSSSLDALLPGFSMDLVWTRKSKRRGWERGNRVPEEIGMRLLHLPSIYPGCCFPDLNS